MTTTKNCRAIEKVDSIRQRKKNNYANSTFSSHTREFIVANYHMEKKVFNRLEFPRLLFFFINSRRQKQICSTFSISLSVLCLSSESCDNLITRNGQARTSSGGKFGTVFDFSFLWGKKEEIKCWPNKSRHYSRAKQIISNGFIHPWWNEEVDIFHNK